MPLEHKPVSVQICDVKSHKFLFILDGLTLSSTISEVKRRIHRKKSHLYADRQVLTRGKTLKDEENLGSIGIVADGCILYLRDLGPQIRCKTAYLLHYLGRLVVYLIFYFVSQVYGEIGNNVNSHNIAVNVALVCWSIHCVKRMLETQFVYMLTGSDIHGTIPILNLAKDCRYYWGFAAVTGLFVKNPLYTPPSFGHVQLGLGLLAFIVGESGNLAIHLAFKNLRPPGTKVRQTNLLRWFDYTTIISWLGFFIITQSILVLFYVAYIVYSIVRSEQMQIPVLAIEEPNNNREEIQEEIRTEQEFSKYPRDWKTTLPGAASIQLAMIRSQLEYQRFRLPQG